MQDTGERIIALTGTLYRVTCGLLNNESDREDAVQSAIEKGWRKASSLKEEQKLKAWLVRILINECYNILRKKKREIPVAQLPEPPEAEASPDLRETVLALPDELRLPIILHYMEGFSIKEIAAVLGLPQGTVLSRMNRARKQLKNIITEGEDK